MDGMSYGFEGQYIIGASWSRSGKDTSTDYSPSGAQTISFGLNPSIGTRGARRTYSKTRFLIGGPK